MGVWNSWANNYRGTPPNHRTIRNLGWAFTRRWVLTHNQDTTVFTIPVQWCPQWGQSTGPVHPYQPSEQGICPQAVQWCNSRWSWWQHPRTVDLIPSECLPLSPAQAAKVISQMLGKTARLGSFISSYICTKYNRTWHPSQLFTGKAHSNTGPRRAPPTPTRLCPWWDHFSKWSHHGHERVGIRLKCRCGWGPCTRALFPVILYEK